MGYVRSTELESYGATEYTVQVSGTVDMLGSKRNNNTHRLPGAK